MALIAFIFHWPPDWLMNRPYSELMDWRRRALDLYQAANAGLEDETP